MVNCGENVLGSQFFITLGTNLDSLDGEPSLPFDPVPIRYDSGDGLPRIDQQNNIFSLK